MEKTATSGLVITNFPAAQNKQQTTSTTMPINDPTGNYTVTEVSNPTKVIHRSKHLPKPHRWSYKGSHIAKRATRRGGNHANYRKAL